MRRYRFDRRSNQAGSTLIEFALSLTVFMMTVFGAFQIGLAVWQYNMVSDLAQEGARWASVRGSSAGASAASESDVQLFVQARSLNINPSVSTFNVNAATKACTSTHTNPSTIAAGLGVCVKRKWWEVWGLAGLIGGRLRLAEVLTCSPSGWRRCPAATTGSPTRCICPAILTPDQPVYVQKVDLQSR